MSHQTKDIIKAFGVNGEYFELVELGAGDGTKTLELLKGLEGKHTFDFMPIDISKAALDNLELRLKQEVPDVTVKSQHGMYFTVLEEIKRINRFCDKKRFDLQLSFLNNQDVPDSTPICQTGCLGRLHKSSYSIGKPRSKRC